MSSIADTKAPGSHFYKSYIRGEFFFGFWNIVSRGIGFVNTFITLAFLTVYQYGVFQLILASYAGLSIFIALGGETIRNDVLRYVGEKNIAAAKKLFFESTLVRILIGIVLWIIVYFGAPLLASKYSPDFIYYIQLISFLFIHDSVLPSVTQLLEVDRDFNLIAVRASVSKFVQFFVLGYYFLFSRIGLREVILSLVIASFVSLVFLLIIVLRRFFTTWHLVPALKEGLLHRLIFSYGKWELLRPLAAKFSNFTQVWLTKIFIGTETVAIFSVAQTMIGTLGNLLPDNTLSVLIPMHVGDKKKMQKIYTLSSKYMVLLSIVMGLVALVLAPPFIRIFFPKYVSSLPLFSVMLFTLPISALIIIPSHFLIAYRKQGFLFLQKMLKAFVGAALYVLLIPFFGVWGLVFQMIILYLFLYIVIYVYMSKADMEVFIDWRRILHFDNSDKELMKMVFADGIKYCRKWLPSFLKS